MLIKYDQFGGVAPRYPDRKLPAPFALTAHNCKMDRAQLRAFGGRALVDNAMTGNTKTVFQYKPFDVTFLLEFAFKADVVQNALPNDKYRRVYWTGDSLGPRFADYNTIIAGARPYPSGNFELGMSAPTGIPIIELGTVDPDFPADPEAQGLTPYYRYYTYTFVDHYGHESPPYADANGGALPNIKVYEGQKVTVKNLQAAPTGNINMQGGLIRLYQTDLIGNWRLVAYAPVGTRQFVDIDHMAIDDKAIMLPETLICEKPLQDMVNLTMHPAGYMLGSSGSTLCTTPRGFYHNWPTTYQRPCAFKILGIVPHAQGAFLITEGGLYSAVGSDPANLTIVEVDSKLGCVSKDSIVDMGGFAMFASYNGIVVAALGETAVVTEDVILHNDWPNYSPKTMKAVRHLDRYIIWNNTHGFILKPNADSDKLVTCDLASNFECSYVDKEDGHLVYRDGTSLYKFDVDPANPIEYTWESTTTVLPLNVVVSCVKLDAENFNDLHFDVFVGGESVFPAEQKAAATKGNLHYSRMPSFRPELDLKVKVRGTSPLNELVLSSSFAEMKGD